MEPAVMVSEKNSPAPQNILIDIKFAAITMLIYAL